MPSASLAGRSLHPDKQAVTRSAAPGGSRAPGGTLSHERPQPGSRPITPRSSTGDPHHEARSRHRWATAPGSGSRGSHDLREALPYLSQVGKPARGRQVQGAPPAEDSPEPQGGAQSRCLWLTWLWAAAGGLAEAGQWRPPRAVRHGASTLHRGAPRHAPAPPRAQGSPWGAWPSGCGRVPATTTRPSPWEHGRGAGACASACVCERVHV